MSQELEAVKHGPADSGRRRSHPETVEPSIVRKGKAGQQRRSNQNFTAAAWAASSYNEQPWRFLVGRTGDDTYAKILDALIEFNQSWAKSAPVLILSVGKKTFTQNGKPNGHGLHDTGAASANLALQATALGLHTHGMAGFDHAKVRGSFGIPEDFEMGAVWALGYLGDTGALPESMQQMEKAPRTRKELKDFVFATWEQPATLSNKLRY